MIWTLLGTLPVCETNYNKNPFCHVPNLHTYQSCLVSHMAILKILIYFLLFQVPFW